jgi:S-DNA-T family DNA segregation ATPase FtsK/SpoIIIE
MGWLCMFAALVIFVALVSYDRRDLISNAVPPNSTPRNFLGIFGAHLASSLFLLVGAAAYTLPVLSFCFGLAGFVPGLAYLRHWRSAAGFAGLLIAATGLLDLFSASLPPLGVRHESLSAGGLVGYALNTGCFKKFFNETGASAFYALIYIGCLILLTDFRIIGWIGSLFERSPANEADQLAAEQAALRKQEKELLKRQRELDRQKSPAPEEEPAEPARRSSRSARAAEPQPEPEPEPDSEDEAVEPPPSFPEPTVRDLSVPQPRPTPEPLRIGDVIRADEISQPGASVHAVAAGETPAVTPPPKARRRSITEVILGRQAATAASPFAPENARTETPAAEPTSDTPVVTDSPAPVAADSAATEPPLAEEVADPATLPVNAPADAPLPVPRPRAVLQPRRNKPLTVASTPMIGDYQIPAIDLLNQPDMTVKPTETKEELVANARLMVQTLAQFGIEVAPGDITKGPTITRYELHPAPGVKLEKIAALTNNIAAALKAERLNVLAPVPGKSSVGVEVPNAIKTKVIMRDLLESNEWTQSKARIPLALGKDVYGVPIIADLAEMPHVLIAGSTGSGKSVCINTIIASLLFKFTPDQLRFVMIDPKVVELQQYNALPHLVVPVVTDPKKVILALRWVVNEMEKRYQIFARVGVRNIKAFNERPKDKLPAPRQPELPLVQKKEKVEPGADGFAVEVDEQIVVPRDEDIVIPEKL